MYIYIYSVFIVAIYLSCLCRSEHRTESMDGELYDVPFASLLMELLGDDTVCHGKLTGAPYNSPLPGFNYYPGHFKRGPTEPAPHI
jgi:hypothetical protein